MLLLENDDAPEFVAVVDRVLSGLSSIYAPPEFFVVKIDNWFGDRWLRFSGNIHGALGVPPFVRSRVLSERRFVPGPLRMAESSGKPRLHRSQFSNENRNRKLSKVAPGAALAWYSGKSRRNGRGSLMCYVPSDETYWTWYVGFAADPWHTTKCVDITTEQLNHLEEAAAPAAPATDGVREEHGIEGAPITRFEPDADRLAVVRECMEHYDMGDPEAEWPNNIISRRTVVYGSGVIARRGESVRHAVDPEELALCRRLSAEAAKLMAGVEVGLGSESGDEFSGFFIAANVDEPNSLAISEDLIRVKFGGSLFPPVTITVEPLAELGVWWSEVELDGAESEPEYFLRWRELIRWFRGRPEFRDAAFVRIGDSRDLRDLSVSDWPRGTQIPGRVLPRLVLGLTQRASLVGLFGFSVQTRARFRGSSTRR